MTPNEVEAVAASDTATLVLVSCLVRFLEAKDVLRRAEFIGFLESTAASFESEGADRRMLQLFRSRIETLRADKAAPESLN